MCKFQVQPWNWFLKYSSKHHPGMNARGLCQCKSTLVQVMAWCCQATSHYYLEQFWPRSLTPYGITRSEWLTHEDLCNDRNLCTKFFCFRISTFMCWLDWRDSAGSGNRLALIRQQASTWINSLWLCDAIWWSWRQISMTPYGETSPRWVTGKYLQTRNNFCLHLPRHL